VRPVRNVPVPNRGFDLIVGVSDSTTPTITVDPVGTGK